MAKLNAPEAAQKFAAALQTVAERLEALETLAWILNRHLARQRKAVVAAYAALGELQPQGKAEIGKAESRNRNGEGTDKDLIPLEAKPWYQDMLK